MIHFHDVSSVIKMVVHDMYSRHFHSRSRLCFTIQLVPSIHYITIRFPRYIFTTSLVLSRWFFTTRIHDTFITCHDGVSRYNMLHHDTIPRYRFHDTFSRRIWCYQDGCPRHILTTLLFPVTTVFYDIIHYINTLYHDTMFTIPFHEASGTIKLFLHDTYSRHFHSRSRRCFTIQLIISRRNTTIPFSRYIFTMYMVLP